MRSIWAVYKRELRLYFLSITAYAMMFGFLFAYGVIVSSNVANISAYNVEIAGSAQIPLTTGDLLSGSLSSLMFLLFLVAPLLTMRLLAEESREGTLEVLMTLPVSESRFIIGKFLSVWTFYTVMLLLTLVHTFLISNISPVDSGLILSAYVGAWLFGGAVLAISMIWSAMTDDQIMAAFLSAMTIILLLLADSVAIWAGGQDITAGSVEFIRELGLQAHYHDTLLEGVFRVHDVLYFFLIMIAGVFITTRLVETRRWRAS
jgi:ABC-2 type transport system permease protein